MELALSLGDTPKPFSFPEKPQKMIIGEELGFCMGLRKSAGGAEDGGGSKETGSDGQTSASSSEPPVQLDLLPFSPVHRTRPVPISEKLPFPWLNEKFTGRREEVDQDGGGSLSSPNSIVSTFPMDFAMLRSGKRSEFEQINGDGASSRGSDEEENGMARKKLRLSKEQSAFLEESFKEHNTLNPKQKLALAKELNLRPRQVEVWFQNRRARTKLKQTEVDCEYLKRCCETLTEENRRLQKELQELRALKASQPFYMQLPATTLTMCPSCERVVTTTSTAAPLADLKLSPSRSQSQQAAAS